MANHRRRPAGATKYLVGFRDNRILLHSLATVRLWSCGSATCCRLHPDSVVGHHWWLQASNFVSHHSRVTLISCRLAAQKDWSPSWPWQQATEVVSRLCVGRCPTPGASRHPSAALCCALHSNWVGHFVGFHTKFIPLLRGLPWIFPPKKGPKSQNTYLDLPE